MIPLTEKRKTDTARVRNNGNQYVTQKKRFLIKYVTVQDNVSKSPESKQRELKYNHDESKN